jgi:peptidoglycan/LPS O-acetylase OafA/YrhL
VLNWDLDGLRGIGAFIVYLTQFNDLLLKKELLISGTSGGCSVVGIMQTGGTSGIPSGDPKSCLYHTKRWSWLNGRCATLVLVIFLSNSSYFLCEIKANHVDDC